MGLVQAASCGLKVRPKFCYNIYVADPRDYIQQCIRQKRNCMGLNGVIREAREVREVILVLLTDPHHH